MGSVGTLLGTLNALLKDMEEAFEGTERTSLGRTMGGIQQMTQKLPADIEDTITRLMAQIEPILVNLRHVSNKVSDPDGPIESILDVDSDVYKNLVKSLDALAGTLQNVEKTTDVLPAQAPQLAAMITEVRALINTLQDVGTAAKNNPILRGGVPEKKEINTGGANTRDMEF